MNSLLEMVWIRLVAGYQVEQRPADKIRPSRRKGVRSIFNLVFLHCVKINSSSHFYQVLGKRVRLVREIIRDVAGFAPYEKRILDIIKVGSKFSAALLIQFSKPLPLVTISLDWWWKCRKACIQVR